MTVQNIIEQVEKLFGKQSEQYMYQLINDALDDIAVSKGNYIVSSTTNLEGYKRWYELADKVIDIKKVEVLDNNDRYVMIPKLVDPHRLLREDTESGDDTLK
jgi:hypothetical protein